MPKLIICTGSDSNMFFLVKGLILSLRRVLPLHDAELAFFDLGCTANQLAWLEARTHKLIKPKDDFGISGMDKFQPYRLGQACRPLLPNYLPGYTNYMWIDADAWIQDASILQAYIRPLETNHAAITPELDIAYRWYRDRPAPYHNYKLMQWAASFGEETARRYSLLPIFNNGVYAISQNSPVWTAWANNLSLSLARGLTDLFDQLSLQKALLETGQWVPLPSRANWMSHYALPQKRPEDGIWIEPRFDGQPIGIVHLVAEKMRETYLRHGLLYEGGDYLSPEEVPEKLREAFLAGRRRPIIPTSTGG